MEEQIAIQKLLRTHLISAQSKNSRFSLRSYSRLLGLNPGALSGIMNGKRNVSKEMAEKITRKLMVDPQERIEILKLFPEKRKYRNSEELKNSEEDKYLQIEASSFRMIAEWEHFAILSLVKTKNFKNDFQWIGERLGITKFRAQEVIQRLVSLGFLTQTPQGKLKRVQAKIRSSDDTVNLSIQKSHEENLELAKSSLYRDSIQERDFTSITMAVDPARLKLAKEMIRKFQDDLAEVLETGSRTEVYRLSMQLFPLTNLSDQKNLKEIIQ